MHIGPNTWHSTVRLYTEQTNVMTRWYSRTSVMQRAARSYNNIALWRSPEPTGKCCLCMWMWGRHRTWSCLDSLNNRLHGVEGRCWERVGGGGVVGVQRGYCTSAGFTFGVNKVWKAAWGRIKATETLHKLRESVKDWSFFQPICALVCLENLL